MTTEIIKKKDNLPMNAETLIQQAIEKGVPVETMERLLAMRRELKAEWAKEQFDKAMAAFQVACPVIKKQKSGGKTNSGTVAYKYAPLESIVEQTKALLNKHGFSYAIQTKTEGKDVVAICIAKHVSGHSESSDMRVPLGTKTGVMSDTQQVAAAITFAKRYAFCNAFGILTGDEDTNAQPAIIQLDANEQIAGFNKAVSRLRATKSVESLNAVWRTLSATLRADDELIAIAKEIKKKLV